MQKTCVVSVLAFAATALLNSSASHAVIVLTGTSYTQNFNGLGGGLPIGITANTGATGTSLGTPGAAFTQTPGSATAWSDSAGAFKNTASVTGMVSTATTATQTGAMDRAFGIRQTAAFGDPGAAFTFQIGNTLGFENFTLAFNSEMQSVQGRSTIWGVRYAIGAAPTSFTLLDTISDTGVFGETPKSYTLGSVVNNQSDKLWIQVFAQVPASGSGSRDTYAVDDFALTYSVVAAVPEASAFLFGGLVCAAAGVWSWRRRGAGLNLIEAPASA